MPNVDDAVNLGCGKSMSDDSAVQRSEAETTRENKTHEDRKIILKEAIARIFGAVATPVARKHEAENKFGS